VGRFSGWKRVWIGFAVLAATVIPLCGQTFTSGGNQVGRLLTSSANNVPYTCTNTSPPVIASVSSASAYGAYPYFASGSWLEIKGSNLADPADPRLTAATNPGQWTSRDFNGVNAPTMLDGIGATVNGKPATVYYLSPGQLNVQAPDDSVTGNVAIAVTNCNATSLPFQFPKQALAPGLLAPPNYSAGGRQYLVATFASDGAYVLNSSVGASFGLSSRPAKAGDVIVAYGIGFGGVSPAIASGTIVEQSNALTNPVTFAFGSTNAQLAYAGLAGGFVGLDEFYITVPSGLAGGDYQINVAQNGIRIPQTVYLTVQNAALPGVQSVTLPVAAVAGGVPVTGTVLLSAAAPAGGTVVALSSNSQVASVPATVTVPAGSSSATFTVSTSVVGSNQTVTITGAYSGTSAQANLAVTPPATALFSQLDALLTFEPVGSPSGPFGLIITPDAGNATFTASDGPITFTHGTVSNQGQTFTFDEVQPGFLVEFIYGSSEVVGVSSAKLVLTLKSTSPLPSTLLGTITGTLSVTGTLYPPGTAGSLSGTITGSYTGLP